MNEITTNITKGHYSSDTKAIHSKKVIAEAPMNIPKHKFYSEKEANKKLREIDYDIYTGKKKEKEKHEFNRSLYFKIFGGIALITTAIACMGKIRTFFRKS